MLPKEHGKGWRRRRTAARRQQAVQMRLPARRPQGARAPPAMETQTGMATATEAVTAPAMALAAVPVQEAVALAAAAAAQAPETPRSQARCFTYRASPSLASPRTIRHPLVLARMCPSPPTPR